MDNQAFESWCIVEVMGHSTYAGFVTEQTIGGSAFIRVDVPESKGRPGFTKLLGPSSIYAITPCTEETARLAAASSYSKPIDCLNYLDYAPTAVTIGDADEQF